MKTTTRTLLALLLALALLAGLTGCGNDTSSPWENATYTADTTFGTGSKTVQVEVAVGDNAVTFTLCTDAETLADALLEQELIAGEDSEYGLYIKTVNGITADYDTDNSYWALYQNGEYMLTGADQTAISNGEHYELVYTR